MHRATASEVFGVAGRRGRRSEQRRYAKIINFGLIYGMSAFGLARQPRHRAQRRDRLHRALLRALSRREALHGRDAARRRASKGYVETLFGRRVYLPEINGGNGPRKSGAERQAINAPMQGTAADLIKLAMIAVQDALDREQRATRMIMQVHDELVFEVPDGRARLGARSGAAHHGRRWRR